MRRVTRTLAIRGVGRVRIVGTQAQLLGQLDLLRRRGYVAGFVPCPSPTGRREDRPDVTNRPRISPAYCRSI